MNFKTHLKQLVTKITVNRLIIIGYMNINISPNNKDEYKVDYLNLMA